MKYLGPLFTFLMMFLLVYAGSRMDWPNWRAAVLIAGGWVFYYITIRQLLDIERYG